MEDMTARVLMASKTDVLNRRVTIPTVEKPLATQVLNHLSSVVKSIFREDTPIAIRADRMTIQQKSFAKNRLPQSFI